MEGDISNCIMYDVNCYSTNVNNSYFNHLGYMYGNFDNEVIGNRINGFTLYLSDPDYSEVHNDWNCNIENFLPF